MIRLRVLTSPRPDQDVEAQLALVERLPRVRFEPPGRPIANQLALIARHATHLLRRSTEADILITVGEPALTTAMLAWQGPLIHLPVGLLTPTEQRLLRWKDRTSHVATVFSTHTAAADAIRRGINSDRVRVVRTAPPALQSTRSQTRERLGIDQGATCVGISGRVQTVRSHGLAIWAAGILAFRDPAWRVLIDPGEQADGVARYVRRTSRPGVTVLCRDCSPSDLAATADVVVVDNDSIPSFVAIASAAQHRIPIVASEKLWRREQLMDVPAILLNDRKPRNWARAVIDSVEGAQASRMDRLQQSLEASTREQTLVHQWLEILHDVCGRKRSLVA